MDTPDFFYLPMPSVFWSRTFSFRPSSFLVDANCMRSLELLVIAYYLELFALCASVELLAPKKSQMHFAPNTHLHT